jgi:prevent-host-death family protein
MQKTWQLQEAKNKFSEVVECAIQEGPQTVSRRGENAVVILSCADYDRLRGGKKNMLEFFRQSPLVGVELDLERPGDLPRDFSL